MGDWMYRPWGIADFAVSGERLGRRTTDWSNRKWTSFDGQANSESALQLSASSRQHR